MAKISQAMREKIPRSKTACPVNYPYPGSYPIHDRSHVASAKAYYQRAYTKKCVGGKARIYRAAKKLGIMGLGDWKQWCKRRER